MTALRTPSRTTAPAAASRGVAVALGARLACVAAIVGSHRAAVACMHALMPKHGMSKHAMHLHPLARGSD